MRCASRLGFIAVALLVGCGVPDESLDHDFVIPAGTGDAIDRGNAVSILPDLLEVHVGDLLRIVNEDSRDHQVGPYVIGAGETLIHRFTAPGLVGGICSVSEKGMVLIRVLE